MEDVRCICGGSKAILSKLLSVDTLLCRAETMVCFTAFSLKADQMPIFGLLLVFFLLKSLHFMNFPQNDD